MNGPGGKGAARPETWGAFLEHATPHGVRVIRVEGAAYPDCVIESFDCLVREAGGETLLIPLPRGWTPDRTLRLVGMQAACDRLRIPKPERWPVTL